MQTQVQNQQSTTHKAKMLHELLSDMNKSHQNTVGRQAEYDGTKNANESSKATKYCAQQQK